MKTLFLTLAVAMTAGCATAETYETGNSVQLTEREAIEVLKRTPTALPVGDADSSLVLLRGSLPGYPKDVIANGIEGVVEIRFTIDEAGLVRNPQVVSSPDARLTAACLRALNEWRFRPVPKEGMVVRIEAAQKFPFKLHD